MFHRHTLLRAAVRRPYVAAAAGYQGPGDIVSGASAWYGLRAYTAAVATSLAAALNIQRSSDNATADIHLLSTGRLNTADPFFDGSATYWILALYDQTGGGNVMTQFVINAPTLVLNAIGSLPGMFFASASSQWIRYGAFSGTAQPITYSTVAKNTNSSATNSCSIMAASGASEIDFGDGVSANTLGGYCGTPQAVSAADNSFHSLQLIGNGASGALIVDGIATTKDMGTNGSASATLALGYDGFNQHLDGYILEAGLWPVGFNATQYGNMNTNQHSSTNGWNF